MNIIIEIEGIKLAYFKEIPAARLRKEKAYGERSQERKKKDKKRRGDRHNYGPVCTGLNNGVQNGTHI